MPNTGAEQNPVHVVAGVIYSPDRKQVLIARRPEHLHQGGKWEFPGGKVDVGESPRQALCRELREELALKTIYCEPLMAVNHDYIDKSVLLDVWQVLEFSGIPVGNEGQTVVWVDLDQLSTYEFPEANRQLVALVSGKLLKS